jgi:TrmH family RNA methyltransferase
MRRLRGRQGDHALLEGPHLVGEALALGLELEIVLATPEALARAEGGRLAAALPEPPVEVAAAVLEGLADADSPRGWLALARLPRSGPEGLSLGSDALLVFLDGVQDPGNVGAIARVSEAFGAEALALAPGCAHPNHPRALRASAGSLLRLPAAIDGSVAAIDGRWNRSPLWIALAAHGGSAPGTLPEGSHAVVVAVGAEGPGLSREVERRVDERWTIRLAGRVESLNVAVATGIVLHALRGERQAASATRTG